MKFLFLLLLSLSLPLEVSAQDSVHSYKYVWGDFTNFNSTAQTKGFTMGAANLDSNGHIVLKNNTVSFSFDRTAVRPSLADNKPFCIGLTFQAGSFSSSSDSLFNLFSGQFNADTAGGTPLDITYNGNTNGSVSFGSSAGQLTNRIDSAKDLTVFINHDATDKLTVSFHSGTEFITSIKFDGLTISGGDLESFIIGDANSGMILKGLGLMVGDSLTNNPDWKSDYFKTVGVQNVPEPGAAILALWGGVFALCLRRRAA